MGIKNLHHFIEEHFPDVCYTVHIKDLNGTTCVLDGMQQIYSQLMRMRQNDTEVFLPDGTNVSHIYALFGLLDYYLKNNIVPIFIFEGTQPDDKKKIIEKRKLLKDAKLSGLAVLEKQCNLFVENTLNAGYSDEETLKLLEAKPFYQKYRYVYSNTVQVKHYYAVDWINILTHIGIPVIKPIEGEADPICGYITKNDPTVFGIISNDSDMLIYGGEHARMLRKIENRNLYWVVETNKILQKISSEYKVNFTHENFIDFSILMGTDYCDFKLKCGKVAPIELLKCYIMSGMNAKFFLRFYDYDKFDEIKARLYSNNHECGFEQYLGINKWQTPNLAEMKKYLTDLNVCDAKYIEWSANKLQTYYMKKYYVDNEIIQRINAKPKANATAYPLQKLVSVL